jgi:hypothetical protein
LPASANNAADRAAVSPMLLKLSGVASVAVGPADLTLIAGASAKANVIETSNPKRVAAFMCGIVFVS